MKGIIRSLVVTAVLLLGLTPSLAGQVLRGTLLDDDRGRPIAAATLLLLNAELAAVDSVRTDARGGFRLSAPAPGEYSVFFQLDGYAGHASEKVRLAADSVSELTYRVPLVASAALREMSDIIGLEPRLQQALPEICGEAFRPWEAGLLVGRVRQRAGNVPLAGVRVAVATPEGDVARSTVSNEDGVYVLCNVPVGTAIRITTRPPNGAAEVTEVEIRAGSASWYDLMVGPRRR